MPTDEQRRLVKAMASFGVPHDDIAVVVRCSPPTLRKRFREELDVATIEANARVAQCLYQQAVTPGNIAATIFWLRGHFPTDEAALKLRHAKSTNVLRALSQTRDWQ